MVSLVSEAFLNVLLVAVKKKEYYNKAKKYKKFHNLLKHEGEAESFAEKILKEEVSDFYGC